MRLAPTASSNATRPALHAEYQISPYISFWAHAQHSHYPAIILPVLPSSCKLLTFYNPCRISGFATSWFATRLHTHTLALQPHNPLTTL